MVSGRVVFCVVIGLNLIAFLYRLTTTLIYAFVETIDLYIVGFWKKTNKQKKSVLCCSLISHDALMF
jgi:hypothetical protein